MKPHNVDYIMGLADAYLSMGKIRTAIEYYQRALSEENNNLYCFEKLIIAFIKSKDYESAQKYCTDAMVKNKEDHKFFFLRGVALDSAKKYQSATMSYERAISMLEEDEKYKKLVDKSPYKYYYSNLARTYTMLYRYVDAQRFYTSAMYIDKSDWKIRLELGKVYNAKTEYSNAIAEFTDALTYSEKNPEIGFYKRRWGYFLFSGDKIIIFL